MSRTAEEVPALISAVTEHQRFRQLACYSIECLSKVIDPSNRDYRKNLAIAHSCGAGKCVVDVLKRHPGKEDVLLICCESLEKLAVDDANSEVIAGEGCVEAILASLEANPEFPEHVLGQALSILDRLCDHKKSLLILVERESIRSLIALLKKGNQKTEVLASCLRGMSKLTRIPKAGADFLLLKGSCPTVKAMTSISESVSTVLPDTNEQSSLFAGMTLFIRLLQLAKKDKESQDAFKALVDDVKSAGGLELCLQVMDKCEDELLSKACSKLLSLLFDSSSIEELIKSMNDGSLSVEMQHHVLNMLGSLAVDPVSSADIVRFGGVSVLVKASELNLSVKLLDMSIKALLYLSSNMKNVHQMVADGAIESLIRTILAPLPEASSTVALDIAFEIKSYAIIALKNICLLQEYVLRVCEAGAVGAMLHCLTDPLRQNLNVSTNALLFLEMLVGCSHSDFDASTVTATNGKSNGILLKYIGIKEIDTVIHSMECFPEDMTHQSSALRALYDLCLPSPGHAAHLISDNFVEEIVSIMDEFGRENVKLLHVCLHLLWTLLLASTEQVAEIIISAHNKTGVDIVLGCIGCKIRVDAIRSVGVEVIRLLASNALVKKVITKLNKLAGLPKRELDKEAVGEVALVAITIGVLAMVPDHLASILSLGGVAPLIHLLSNITLIPIQDDEEGEINVYHEALNTLCSALEEIISSSDILQIPNLVETIKACVNVLQKHSKLLSIVQSALRLLTVVSASAQQEHKLFCIDNGVLEAIGGILRANPTNSKIVPVVTKIYGNFSDCDNDMAIVICRRNASKMIISCIEKNLAQITLDGTEIAAAECSPQANAQMISSFLPILYRLSTIIPEGPEILRRQGTLNCLCETYEKFHLLQSVDGKHQMNRSDIRDWCLKIIRLLLEESDVIETLKKLEKKKSNSRPGLFSLTERSVDLLGAASLDVLRLGLLMLCGPQVVNQIESAGGVVLLCECLYNFSPDVNAAECESSLVARARDEFINYCIQALGRAALGNVDIEATIAIIPLLVAAATANPTVGVFVTMTQLGQLHPSVVEALVQAGAVAACLKICQADVDLYSSDLVAAAFSCLSLLARNETGLGQIVENNAINLVCQFVTESLDLFQEDRELVSGTASISQLDSIRSALSMLFTLVNQHDASIGGNINVDIIRVICHLIDVFVELSADFAAQRAKSKTSSTSTFSVNLEDNFDSVDVSSSLRGSVVDENKALFPDLLAVTMDIVKVLITGRLGEEYCTALIEKKAIKYLDSLMSANDDTYLRVTITSYAMAHLWSVLVVENRANTGPKTPPPPPPPGQIASAEGYTQADSRGYVSMLQSRDFILRTMNYHTQELNLQRILAQIVGCLGVDGGATGLMAFVEQVRGLLNDLSESSLAQMTRLVQLIGNLMLVDGMLAQDIGESLFRLLLEACQQLRQLVVEKGSASSRDEALKACFVCLNKVLAVDDPAIFLLSDDDMEALIIFIQAGLESIDSDKATKLSLLFLLTSVINKTSSDGNGTFLATVLCLSHDIYKSLMCMDDGEPTNFRFSRKDIGNSDGSDNVKLQRENAVRCLFTSIFCQGQIAYLLYAESGYQYISTICTFMCSALSQNNPSSELYWKTILLLFMEETWLAYFGPTYLMSLLSELMNPTTELAKSRLPSAVNAIRCEILSMLVVCINNESLTFVEDEVLVDGIITACVLEIQCVADVKDPSAISTSEWQLFTILTMLADSKNGARAIALNSTIRNWLLDKLVKSGDTASSASGVVTKLLFHEDMEVVETLVQKQLTKRILMSLKSAGMKDEGLAQNSLYLLRVLADFLSMEALELPKDTIGVLSDLIYNYSSNEYLVGVATSLKNDLLGAYAVGPESQLEQLLDTIATVHQGADGWMQTPDENGYLYYYNSSDGASQWEEPEGYTMLIRTLTEIVEITSTTLKNNLSNVALTTQHMNDFYQILLYQGSDTQVLNKVMQFLYAQATKSGPITRDLLKELPETHIEVLVAALHSQMENLEVPEAEDEASLQAVQQIFHVVDNLLVLPGFKEKLSGEEYIHLLCQACRKFIAHPVVLSRALTALGRLIRKDVDLVLIAFKYEFHIIMNEVMYYHTERLPADDSTARAEFLEFLTAVDNNSGYILRGSLGGAIGRRSTSRGSILGGGDTIVEVDNDVECSPFMPVLKLCILVLSLWQTLLAHRNSEIVLTLSQHCFPSVLAVGKSFMSSETIVNQHLLVISRFASQQESLQTIVTQDTVNHLIELITFHIANISLISSALVLFSDFAAIERNEEEDGRDDQFCASVVILDAGGFALIDKVIQAHMNKPVVLILCMEVIFNLIEPESADSFINDSHELLTSFFESSYGILNRYDFDHSLVLSTLQTCVQFTTNGIGVDLVFVDEVVGPSRLTMLLDTCQSLIQERAETRVVNGDEEEESGGSGGQEEEDEEEEELSKLSTKDAIVYHVLALINTTLNSPETAQLLSPEGSNSADNEAVRVVIFALSTFADKPPLLRVCLTFLLAVANIDDNLSRNVGERGSMLFIKIVEENIDNTTIVSLIFQLFGRLVFIKENLMSFVQHKGIGLLLNSMETFYSEEELITSAVTTLGNIVSSDEECSNLVLEAGGQAAVEAVQSNDAFQPSSDFPDVHSAARSTLLSITARLRAKDRVGKKTNVGALMSRIGQDIGSVINSDHDKVKESKLDMNMADPLTPSYRSALKSGQLVTDYVKGATIARKLWLTSDCNFLVLKEDTNNVKKPGRKIKLQNVANVQKGYGPGHYKSSMMGGKKTKAKEDYSLYLSHNGQGTADDDITLEFANVTDRDKWFEILTALLVASESCPHYLQEL